MKNKFFCFSQGFLRILLPFFVLFSSSSNAWGIGNPTLTADPVIAESEVPTAVPMAVDPDGSFLAAIKLTVSNGTLNVTLQGSTTFASGSNDSATFRIRNFSSDDDLLATLATLKYTSNSSYTGSDTLEVDLEDKGAFLSDTISITVAAANNPPTIGGVSTISGDEDTPIDVVESGNYLVADDSDPDTLRVDLSVSNGLLYITPSGGLTIPFGENGGVSMSISGTEADINDSLETLTYQAIEHYHGSDTLEYSIRDGSVIGDTQTIDITINPVNDSPSYSAYSEISGFEDVELPLAVPALVSTISGPTGYLDGNLSEASFSNPRGIVFDSAGNLYLADSINNRIRKVSSDGVVSTIAGDGSYASLDGIGTAAQIQNPRDITIDGDGNLYFVEARTVRKIATDGTVTTIAGAPSSFGADDGTKAQSTFTALFGIAYDSSNNFVYVADDSRNLIRKIDLNTAEDDPGYVSTLAGSTSGYTDGVGTAAQFKSPKGLDVDSSGNVYVADSWNFVIRKITPAGVVTTVAGDGSRGLLDGTGTAAKFHIIQNVFLQDDDTMYVVSGNTGEGGGPYYIRRIELNNNFEVTTIIGDAEAEVDGALDVASLSSGFGLEMYGGELFFTTTKLRKINFGKEIVSSDPDEETLTGEFSVTNGTLKVTLSGSATISAGANESSSLSIQGSVEDINDTLQTLEFLGNQDFNGTSTLTFSFEDASSNSGEGTINITVNPVNDEPSGADDTISVDEDNAHTFAAGDFGFSDPVDGDSLESVTVESLPSVGSLQLSSVDVTADQVITANDIANLVFTPVADMNGTNYASFTFSVTDDGGTNDGGVDTDATPNTITFDVNSVNDAPSGTDKTIAINEDDAHTFAAADFGFSDDADSDSFASVTVNTLPANGSLQLSSVDVTVSQVINVGDLTNLVFTPVANMNGTNYASFTFSVTDDGGTSNGGVDTDASPNTITFDVTSINDAPAGADKTITLDEDGSFTFSAADFGFSDPLDSDALESITLNALAINGSLQLSSVDVTASQVINASDLANLVFTPVANMHGTNYASFTFSVTDDGGTSNGGIDTDASPNTITLDVTSINDAPAGADKTITLDEDGSHTFSATDFGFTDAADSDSFASVTINTLPASGSFQLSSVDVTASQAIPAANLTNLVFSPEADENGANYATFTFSVTDDGGTSDGGVDTDPTPNAITLDVTPINDLPTIANPGDQEFTEKDTLPIMLAISDVETASGDHNIEVSSTDAGLEFSLEGTTLNLTADGWYGTATVTIEITDEDGGMDSIMFDVTVTPFNTEPPVHILPEDQLVDTTRPHVLSIETNNAVQVDDIDSPTVTMTLSVEFGVIHLQQTTGLTFENDTNDGESTLTISGAIGDINAALDGMTYTGTSGYVGGDTLILDTVDHGGLTDHDELPLVVQIVALAGQPPLTVNTIKRPGETLSSISVASFDEVKLKGFEIKGEGDSIELLALAVGKTDGSVDNTTVDLLLEYESGESEIVTIPVVIYHARLGVIQAVTGLAELNRQTGLYEKIVEVENPSPYSMEAIRIYVDGLNDNVSLRSVSGTSEEGLPYVQYDVPLAPGEIQDFKLEFLSKTRRWDAEATFLLELLPEAGTEPVIGELAEVDMVTEVSEVGDFYLNFITEPDTTYYIQYAPSIEGPWKTSPVTLKGTGERELWLDDGPPKTLTHPSEEDARFYRVILPVENQDQD